VIWRLYILEISRKSIISINPDARVTRFLNTFLSFFILEIFSILGV